MVRTMVQGEGKVVPFLVDIATMYTRKGTLTLGLELQSIISRALDENNHVLMASLDLSSAYNSIQLYYFICLVSI